MSKTRWLGDGALIPVYMRFMEDLWTETSYTEDQKRDIVAVHMRDSDDSFIKADLAEFHRAGGGIPFGPNYSFAFLWDSLRPDRGKGKITRRHGRQRSTRFSPKHSVQTPRAVPEEVWLWLQRMD